MTAGDCGSDHCVTCSDEGTPMRIVAVAPDGLARCLDDEGDVSDVMTDLVGDVERGDRVLVHAGVALALLAESPNGLSANAPEDFR